MTKIKYYYIDDTGFVCQDYDDGSDRHQERKDFHNYFINRQDAAREANRLQFLNELRELSDDYGELYFHRSKDGYIRIEYNCDYDPTQGLYRFATPESALHALETLGQERIERYLFNVPEPRYTIPLRGLKTRKGNQLYLSTNGQHVFPATKHGKYQQSFTMDEIERLIHPYYHNLAEREGL